MFGSDFLLGVHDRTRMGGLRFKLDPNGPFLDEETPMEVPPIASLRKLEAAARQIEEQSENHPDLGKWLEILLAPGTSLGGARPKATVIDEKGNLWVGKFPSSRDEYDVGALETVAYTLAADAGLRTSTFRMEEFSKNGHTFLARRFDRDRETRIHFASAMCLLGYSDGDEGMSYLEMADFIRQHGARPDADLEELWRRIVFNIAVRNTDDHLRNHGFLLTAQGWTLSPLFDVNPQPWGSSLALNINESSNALDFDLALETSDHYRVPRKRAEDLVGEIQQKVSRGEEVARSFHLAGREIDILHRAITRTK